MRLALAGIVFIIVLAAGGLVVLASAPLSPSVQKVEQVIPDDHFPR
jgi:hypothetical protein